MNTGQSTSETTPRRKPRFGISYGCCAYCHACGWSGDTWYGKGSQRSAAAQLAEHKELPSHRAALGLPRKVTP